MKRFAQFIREQDDQFSYKGMTTKHFDICPSALAAFKKNAEAGDFDDGEFREAVMAVDKYLGIEKDLKAQGSATQEDYERMKKAVDDAVGKLELAGLEGHSYHQVHLDAVKELME